MYTSLCLCFTSRGHVLLDFWEMCHHDDVALGFTRLHFLKAHFFLWEFVELVLGLSDMYYCICHSVLFDAASG